MKKTKNCSDLMNLFDGAREAVMRVVKKIYGDLDLTYSEHDHRALFFLKKTGRAKLKDIALFAGPKPMCCLRLGILERKKIVIREPDPDDRRNVYYRLSPRGEKYVEKIISKVGDLFARLSDRDTADLGAALETMTSTLMKLSNAKT
jgi:hypothetical protein